MYKRSPDSAKNFAEYERFMQELLKVMMEGRKEGAVRFFVAGDLNTELGFLMQGRGRRDL